MGGYVGKFLKINLSSGKVNHDYAIDNKLLKNFVGGRGLGARLLWDLASPGIDPLSPESPLLFLTGPLTGIIPGGAQTCIVCKSPLTENTLTHSLVGGAWGPELKFAGYDGIIVTGKAEKPVLLFINDNRVELLSAEEYWGLTTSEAAKKIHSALDVPDAQVLCIGPAGERLIRFASIQHELFRSAARGGAGCVMGSKNLKAVVVHGSGRIAVNAHEDFLNQYHKVQHRLTESRRTTSRGYKLARWGSTVSSLAHSDLSELDVKNYREAYWPRIDAVGGLEYEYRYKVKSRSCFLCPVSCMQLGVVKDGHFKGFLVNPDFDSSGTIGPGLLLEDLGYVVYLSRLADDWGMDAASLGNVAGFAIECYEKGLLTPDDLDGLRLSWGDGAAILELCHRILNRQGFGDLLAEGVKKASQFLGAEAKGFAMHVKGLEFAGYAPQAHHDRALQYAVGDRGGCHHFGLNLEEQNRRAWADSLTVCTWHHYMVTPQDYLHFLNYATGSEYKIKDWEQTAVRILLMARMYNIREGMVPERDDVLPERVHTDALQWGPKKGALYPQDKFIKDREEWYRERGCDERGFPLEETLQGLGLGFALQVLREQAGEGVPGGD